MAGKEERRVTVLAIIVGVALIIAGVVMGIRSGWSNDEKVILSEEYYGEFIDFDKISAEEYEELINNKKSFVVLVDQDGCHTADRLKEYIRKWAPGARIKVLKTMFSEMRETSMHEKVKYYPSVVVIENGEIRAFLRADSDEDADEYNDYEAFKGWIEQYI